MVGFHLVELVVVGVVGVRAGGAGGAVRDSRALGWVGLPPVGGLFSFFIE